MQKSKDSIIYTRPEIETLIRESLGGGYEPLFKTQIFLQICDAFYDYIFCEKLDLELDETKADYIEILQAWNHLKDNFKTVEPEKDELSDRLRALYEKEKMNRDLRI
tara:strand:- start:20 stop:340 length:321 start_codon:yes stop_codon:yes gene_type:complete